MAVKLTFRCQHALEVVHRKGDFGPSREKRRGWRRLVKSYATQCINWKRERPRFFTFENAIEEDKSVWNFVELGVMG